MHQRTFSVIVIFFVYKIEVW